MFSRSHVFRAAIIDHYERLGLKLALSGEPSGEAAVHQYSDFTEFQIKAAYRRRALECHPDVALGHEKASAEAEFRRISESFAILQDQARRKEIDNELQQLFDIRTQRRSGRQSPQRPIAYAYPSDKQRMAAKKEQHDLRRQMKAPFNEQATPKDQSAWKDNDGNIWSTNPVGTGVPSYSQYIKDVEIEEGQPVSAYTSTWVTGAERQTPKRSASATSSRRPAASARQSFLRKDADQAFKQAFDGKGWKEVLFQMRYNGRYGKAQSGKDTPHSTAEPEPVSDATPGTYKLKSPIFKDAKPAPVDEDVVRRRLEAFRRQAGGYNRYNSTTVTATDYSPPQPPTADIKASPIYSRMVDYANAAYHRQELAGSWEPTAAANGGPVNFPHIAASQEVGGNIADRPGELESAEMVQSSAQRPDVTNLGLPYSKLLKNVTTRDEANRHLKRQKQEIGYNEGQLYSYQRPY